MQLAALLALALAGAACRLRAWADRDADLLACARLLEALLVCDALNLLGGRLEPVVDQHVALRADEEVVRVEGARRALAEELVDLLAHRPLGPVRRGPGARVAARAS